MNFAEGSGPRQVKRTWPLGQFVTLYGVDGHPSNVHPATPPYPSLKSNGTFNGGVPGSVVPGLILASGVNNNTDVGFVCSPGSMEAVTDILSTVVTLTAESDWSGTAHVTLQGTQKRYIGTIDYSSTNWVNIVSGTVTSGNVPVRLAVNVASGTLYNAYRLVASGGHGIIDWAIAGMFTDLSAMQVGANATDANGQIGQMSIQNPRRVSISGNTTTVSGSNTPYENIKSNHTWIG